MKKELPHFNIGSSYGGNQEWFRTFMMRLGGCGAETACDASIYFARERGVANIYPFDAGHLTREDYVNFGHQMERYLWPRRMGINTLDTFIDGYTKYLQDAGVTGLTMRGFSGSEPYEEAAAAVRSQIDAGYPVTMLMLRHAMRRYRDYVWHWFLINGYDTGDDPAGATAGSTNDATTGSTIDAAASGFAGNQKPAGVIPTGTTPMRDKVVTYSEYEWLNFEEFWNTGYEQRGGLILYHLD